MSLDDRIRDNLDAAARSTGHAPPRPVEEVKRAATRRRAIRLASWSAMGATAIVALVFVAVSRPGFNVADPATEGDPMVTQGDLGPAPEFDTSELGEDVTLLPIEDISTLLEDVRSEDGSSGSFGRGSTFLVTLLGRTHDGIEAYVTHSTGMSDGSTLQHRCLNTKLGGFCSGIPIEDAERYPDGLIPPAADGPLSLPGHAIGGPGEMTWEVSPATSVVMVTIDGVRSWARPIAQTAVFVTDLKGGEEVRATAFDARGEIVAMNSFTVETQGEPSVGFDCPITLPTNPDFAPPEGYPTSPDVGQGWFGSAALWTTLPVDGAYLPRKSLWWSQNFPGGGDEEEPPITVTWDRLDVDVPPLVVSPGTNAQTAGEGDFIIAGIDPTGPGCWEVTASYKGATVRYVYEKR